VSTNLPAKPKKYPALQAWSRELALWYATQSAKPSTEQCLEKCAEIGHSISKGYWYNVSASPEFRSFVKQLQDSGVALAKAKFEESLPKVADHFNWALEAARAVGDYNAVRALVEMGVDRFWPKKVEGPAVAAQINISLSPERIADMGAARVPIQTEIVEINDTDADL
jgi:hypothetical protein